jgi:2-oxoglutarate decarboxylase
MTGVDRSRFGPNVWLVDELYRRYVADPASVSEAWREFFEGYRPRSGDLRDQAAMQAVEAPALQEPHVEPSPDDTIAQRGPAHRDDREGAGHLPGDEPLVRERRR